MERFTEALRASDLYADPTGRRSVARKGNRIDTTEVVKYRLVGFRYVFGIVDQKENRRRSLTQAHLVRLLSLRVP